MSFGWGGRIVIWKKEFVAYVGRFEGILAVRAGRSKRGYRCIEPLGVESSKNGPF
jgi:hypothetical protein